MTFSNINIGTAPNDGTGTVLRTAFQYVNDNFDEVNTFMLSQVTTSYLTATLSNYVTSTTFNSNNSITGATLSSLQTQIDGRALLVHTHSVSNVTGLQGQLDAKATITQLNNAIATLNDTISTLNGTIANKIDEAPEDDNFYVRKNGAWVVLP